MRRGIVVAVGAAAWIALAVGATAWIALAAGAHEDERAHGAPRYEAPPAGSYALPPIDRVADHTLLAADGTPAPLPGLAPGELALVSFVYLSCGEACPLATATLHRLDRLISEDAALASRVQLVTVSFDPARDTPERMSALAENLSPKGRWRFLTAEDASALAPVLRDFGQDAVWIPDPEHTQAPDRLRHVLKVFLVDDANRVRNIYSTGLMDVRLVVNDLRTLLGEDALSGAAVDGATATAATRSR